MSRSRRGKRKTLRKRAEDLLSGLMPMILTMADLRAPRNVLRRLYDAHAFDDILGRYELCRGVMWPGVRQPHLARTRWHPFEPPKIAVRRLLTACPANGDLRKAVDGLGELRPQVEADLALDALEYS